MSDCESEAKEMITEQEVEEVLEAPSVGDKRGADDCDATCLKKLKVDSKMRVQRIRKANSRFWIQVCKKLNKWVYQTSPHEPSFAMLYLMRTRGRVQVVWEGPEHMEEFAMDQLVVDKFREVSMKPSKSLPVKIPQRTLQKPLRVHSKDVKSYRSDQLSKLISEILNPGCRRNFYREENKPHWYPQHVPFKAPNHRTKDGKPKLNVDQNREILKAFFNHCPDRFTVEGEDEISDRESEEGDSSEEGDLKGKALQLEKVWKRGFILQVQMTPTEALSRLSEANSWSDFLAVVRRVESAVEQLALGDLKHQTLQNLDESFVDTNTPVLEEFQALVSTGDGNCLYNSISILLSGDESLAMHLRLASVLHAIGHFHHYLTMLEDEVSEVDMAVQFLYTVAGSNSDVDGRPKTNPSVTDVHTYTLHTLIRDTAKIGRDAGFLQLLFLAGAMGHPIQQYCNLDGYELYNTLVPTCSCMLEDSASVLHIMWTNFSRTSGGCPNHIIPLVEKHPTAAYSVNMDNPKLPCDKIGQTCLMWGKCSESLATQGKKTLDWVICSTCQAWYHNVCVGLCPTLTAYEDFDFSCCATPSPKDNLTVVKNPLTVKRGIQQSTLNIADIQSLYPWNGLSDAAIDFYIREMLPLNHDIVCVGALTYTGIVKASERPDGDDKSRLAEVHQSTNGKLGLSGKKLIMFPCRTSGAWHWIMVAVAPDLGKAFVMDSTSNLLTPHSNSVVKGIKRFLIAMGVIRDGVLTPVPMKVYQQTTSTDCGIHVIHNMTQLVLHSTEGMSALEESFSCVAIRRQILAKAHNLTRKCLRRLYPTSRMEAYKQSVLDKIHQSFECGLKEIATRDKGRGVVADKLFQKGDFLCNYKGDLITKAEGERRMEQYGADLGSFLFFFNHNGNDLCIDATKEDGLGRLMNHSKLRPNVEAKIFTANSRPYLCMFAATTIKSGEELLYDYGDRSKVSIENFAWLKQ